MTMPYKLIGDIKDGDIEWTAKVFVAEKPSPKIGSVNPVLYQTLTFMDTKGDTVKGVIWERHIPYFEEDLQLGKTYLISNAHVKPPTPRFQRFSGELQWTFSGSTGVQLINETYHDLLFSSMKLLPFSDLRAFMNLQDEISTMAVVIAAQPRRPQPTKTGGDVMVQDIILLDKSFETFKLRLWGSYAEHEGQQIINLLPTKPIVIAAHLQIKSKGGLSMSTGHNSCFYINFPFAETQAFRTWINENEETIVEITALQQYLIPKIIEACEDTIVSPVKEAHKLLPNQYCWIKALARVKLGPASYWYMSCNNCYSAATATIAGRTYSFRYCKDPNATAVPRARADVELTDNTGTISASMMGEVAECYFNASASKLMRITRSKLDFESNIQLDKTVDHLFYLMASTNKTAATERAKASSYQQFIPGRKLEVVSVDIYDAQKHKLIPVESIDPENQEGKESSSYTQTADIASSTPTAKRNLFTEPTPSTPTKKKLLSKMD